MIRFMGMAHAQSLLKLVQPPGSDAWAGLNGKVEEIPVFPCHRRELAQARSSASGASIDDP